MSGEKNSHKVQLDSVFSESFAHVCEDGKIRRYQEVIGDKNDLSKQEG